MPGPQKRRFRRSKLDQFAHLVGKIPDREVAAMAGITPDGVRMYRQRHAIPSVSSFRKTNQGAPTPKRIALARGPRSHAFNVSIRRDDEEQNCVVLSSDIVAATRVAMDSVAGQSAEVTRVQYIAEALN